jgi:hypothetical protein
VTTDLKLGLNSAIGPQPPSGGDLIEVAQRVEQPGRPDLDGRVVELGRASPLVWAAARTPASSWQDRADVGSQPGHDGDARTTLDALRTAASGSGSACRAPQVVEGWYGRLPFGQPLARTREYIDILRQVWRRGSRSRTSARTIPSRTTGRARSVSASRSR